MAGNPCRRSPRDSEIHSRPYVRRQCLREGGRSDQLLLRGVQERTEWRSEDTTVEVLARYGKGEEPDEEGTVRYAHFSLVSQEFGAMDSAREHKFAFNEAISFLVPCDTQQEIDYFWGKLSVDPKAEQCGWLKDKYGLSWQITAAIMQELLGSGDRARTERVTKAFLKMKKVDIAEIKRAAAG